MTYAGRSNSDELAQGKLVGIFPSMGTAVANPLLRKTMCCVSTSAGKVIGVIRTVCALVLGVASWFCLCVDRPLMAEMVEGDRPFQSLSVDERLEILAQSSLARDDEGKITSANLRGEADLLWMCIAAFLVFAMQAGFACVEIGFTRAKNAANILMKNLLDFCVGSLLFWAVGFGLMFGKSNGLFGTSHFFFHGEKSYDWGFLIFQTVFCATAATIVSGAVAERIHFHAYLIYSAVISALTYPIFGSWVWGAAYQGTSWLGNMGFHDFAGSTVVHSIGGWAALAGALVLGPRLGKYRAGRIVPIPGHNIPLAGLGVFILWLGWFGFNPGSTLSIGGGHFAYVAVTTNLAASAGAIGALIVSWLWFKKPDPSFALNGALAGLVAITAGCDVIPASYSVLTGAVAGGVVVISAVLLDRAGLDDPVGAVSVHGVCGAWGTLAVGLFATEGGLLTTGEVHSLLVQLLGIVVAFLWSFLTSLALFLGIKYTVGLRVDRETELRGLDITEHGLFAYPEQFVIETGPTEVVGNLGK